MNGSAASHRVGPPRAGIAERIWEAARHEFSRRGYHGARVQGIARGAACNVALMYRHWPSKRALYLDILRAVWLASANEIARIAEGDGAAPREVMASLVDAMMGDPMGAQILIREYLDGAPFLAHLSSSDPSILAPVRRAAAAFTGGGLDPVVAVVTVGGFAALVASTREAARPLLGEPMQPEAWRRHVLALLVNGLSPGPSPTGASGGNGARPP